MQNSIASIESQLINIDGIGWGIKGISDNNSFNHSASIQVVSRAINSASIVLLAIMVYLVHCHALPPKMNTYPVVDLISKEFDIQFALVNPSKTDG